MSVSDNAAAPARTFAVVVGVETYALPGKNLDGPASDAARFVRWLRNRGVPAANIDLLVSPLAKNAEALAQLQIEYAVPVKSGATYEAVRREFLDDLAVKPKQPADLLWIFWGGHGVVTGALDRRLILADASEKDCRNLDLESLLARLHGSEFARLPRQIALIDACAYFTPRLADPLTFSPGKQLQPDCRQFVMLACKPGEAAKEDGTRKTGLFSAAVLDALEQSPEAPFPPDMVTLAGRLKETFEKLRARRQASQTPTTYEYRPWDDSRVRLSDHRAREDDRSNPWPAVGSDAVPWDLKNDLVRVLLACDVIEDPIRRLELLKDMRWEIKAHVAYSPHPMTHVKNLVRRCLDVSGGIEELIEMVRDTEPGAAKMEQLDDRVRRVLEAKA